MGSRKIELIKKVKALADRGVEGEKESAIKLLKKLMDEYGIDDADLSGEKEESHSFSYCGEFEKKLLVQIFYKHFPDFRNRVYSMRRGKGSRSTFFIDCTKIKAIEISIEFDFYRELWKEEVNFFYSAFVQKHYIYPKNSEVKAKTLSVEDGYRMQMMMEGLQDKTLKPRIGINGM